MVSPQRSLLYIALTITFYPTGNSIVKKITMTMNPQLHSLPSVYTWRFNKLAHIMMGYSAHESILWKSYIISFNVCFSTEMAVKSINFSNKPCNFHAYY